jgi:hypothetical protein
MAFLWGKPVENRTWTPPKFAVGQWLAIHGGAVPTGAARREAMADLTWLVENGLAPAGTTFSEAVRTGVVAVGRLDRVITRNDVRDPILGSRWFSGPVGWVFSEVNELPEPVPCSGKLGLWQLPEDVSSAIGRQAKVLIPRRRVP